MSSLAVLARLDPRVVADLDEDEYDALIVAVEERLQAEAWTNSHEVLAAAVEALWAILARLEAGVGVIQVQEAKKPHDYGRYPRPSWIEPEQKNEDKGVVVMTNLREAVAMMKGDT